MTLLKDRDFLLLFAGQGIARFGDGLYTAAIAWLAWSLTHDPAAVALVAVASSAPAFLVTFIAASYADRHDRRRLMIATDLARAALVATVVSLFAFRTMNLTVLVTGTALLSLIGAPFAPARNAIVPQVVSAERLQEANSLLQVAFRAAFFIGPLALAPLLAVASLNLVLAVNGLTFLVSAAAVAALRVRAPARDGRPTGLRSDLAAGLAALRAEPEVLIVIATFVLALTVASGFLSVGLVALVGEGGQYGLLLGIAGVAEVVGALVLAGLPVRRLALAAVLAWALLGAFRFPLGLATSPVVAAALLALTGLASALTDIPLIALVQRRIPDSHLAKALGLWEAGIAGALTVSPFIASTTITVLGVKTAFMLSGAALMTLAAVAATVLAAITARTGRRTPLPPLPYRMTGARARDCRSAGRTRRRLLVLGSESPCPAPTARSRQTRRTSSEP
ncbi:MFS transporter [Streptomyces sioyaensis]|uniref:MFS transporter n=1 Tax=Streptomyces sioyaensis TaxID=67364 RepID=UPI0037AFDA89